MCWKFHNCVSKLSIDNTFTCILFIWCSGIQPVHLLVFFLISFSFLILLLRSIPCPQTKAHFPKLYELETSHKVHQAFTPGNRTPRVCVKTNSKFKIHLHVNEKKRVSKFKTGSKFESDTIHFYLVQGNTTSKSLD